MQILEELYFASKMNKLNVSLRYHPSEQSRAISLRNVLSNYGFKVLDSSREAFVSAIVQADVVMGCGSTALTIAKNYGKKVFFIDIPVKGVFCFRDKGIVKVKICDIRKCFEYKIDNTKYAMDAMNVDAILAL